MKNTILRELAAFSLLLLLAGCQSHAPFASTNEPYRSAFQRCLHEEPDSKFTRACRGDAAALHSYFIQGADPTLDGERAEGFTAVIHAIKSYLGDRQFFEALSRESAQTQHAISLTVPRHDPKNRGA